MRRALITGAFVVALAGSGAAYHPVTPPAPEPGRHHLGRSAATAVGVTPPKSAEQVRGERLLTEASKLLRDADSVRMAAAVTKDGKRIRTDLRMDADGNCVGTLDAGPGMRGDLVVLAGEKPEAYMRFTDASLAELRAMAEQKGGETAARIGERTALVRGKYVKSPPGPKGADAVAKQCRIGEAMGAQASATAGTRAQPTVRRNGRSVVPLVPPAGSGDRGKAYVDARGKPYLRSLQGVSGGASVSVTFSEYGAPVSVRRPAPGLIVEFPADEDSMFAV
ncbi:hypothetical protein [Streptomyces sp. KL116D]|uniref:hypothetical protein n=1 Tax=Streptomyces sp. KL116D TaxID=3045152 RepID=UPI0035585240